LVVNSILQEDRRVKAKVGCLQSVLDTGMMGIENALVILTEDGVVNDTLSHVRDGLYYSFTYPKAGSRYEIRVRADGYPDAYACDTVPVAVEVIGATRISGASYDESGLSQTDYTVTLTDTEGPDFYELLLITQARIDNSNYSIGIEDLPVKNDPVLSAEGLDGYSFRSLVFSDRLIEKQTYTFNFKFGLGSGGSFKEPIIFTGQKRVNAAVLRSVSRAYYNYRKSWIKHWFGKNDSFKVEEALYIPLLGDPSEMYSNIDGGLGVFAAFSQTHFIIE